MKSRKRHLAPDDNEEDEKLVASLVEWNDEEDLEVSHKRRHVDPPPSSHSAGSDDDDSADELLTKSFSLSLQEKQITRVDSIKSLSNNSHSLLNQYVSIVVTVQELYTNQIAYFVGDDTGSIKLLVQITMRDVVQGKEEGSSSHLFERNQQICLSQCLYTLDPINKVEPILLLNYHSLLQFHLDMGISCSTLGHFNSAIEHYRKAEEIDSRHPDIYNNMGSAYDDLGEYNKAIECYQRAISIDCNHVPAYYHMGLVWKKLERYMEAIQCFQQAIERNPHFLHAFESLGNVYFHLEQHQDAIDAYSRVVKLDPDRENAHYNMGIAYNCMDQYNKAIECFTHAIRLNSERLDTVVMMITAYGKLGRMTECLEIYGELYNRLIKDTLSGFDSQMDSD